MTRPTVTASVRLLLIAAFAAGTTAVVCSWTTPIANASAAKTASAAQTAAPATRPASPPATRPAAITSPAPTASPTSPTGVTPMNLGNFSVSLVVKDIAASRAFYEKLGFKVVAGDQSKNWLVLQNDTTKIGLFQGMFPRNTLTFNPGWDGHKNTLESFTDIRDLQKELKARGLSPSPAADESSTGPAYLMLTDPDGNPILLDQHVPSPKK